MKLDPYVSGVPVSGPGSGGRLDPGKAALPDRVGEQNAAEGAAAGARLFSQGIAQMGEDQRQAEHDAAVDASQRIGQARLDMTKMLEEHATSAAPGAPNFTPNFLTAFDSYSQETIGNAPPPVQKYLKERLGLLRTDLGESALHFESTAQLAQRQAKLNGAVDNLAMAVRKDPSQYEAALGEGVGAVHGAGLLATKVPDAEAHVRASIASSAIEGMLDKDPQTAKAALDSGIYDSALGARAKNVLLDRTNALIQRNADQAQAAARAQVASLYDDERAAITDRGTGLGKLTPGMIRTAYPEDKYPGHAARMIAVLDEDRVSWQQRQAHALTGQGADVAAVNAPIDAGAGYAEGVRNRDLLARTVSAKWRAIGNDPVAYLENADPALKGALADAGDDPVKTRAALGRLDADQAALGIPAEARTVLGSGRAKALASSIEALPPDQAANRLTALATTYGATWPKAFGEMVRDGKLSPSYQVVSAVADPGARSRLIEALQAGPKKLADAIGPDKTEIDKSIPAALAPFLGTLASAPNGAQLSSAWKNAASLLAYRYRETGASTGDAVTQAVNGLVGARYDIVTGSHYNARAPKGEGDQVEAYADQVLAALKPEEVDAPAETARGGSEGMGLGPDEVLKRNQPFVKPGATDYATKLDPADEQRFRAWVKANRVPFNPDDPTADYDMRGFWQALQKGDPKARQAIDPNDNRMHFPDFWKTPYDYTFSAESKFANGDAPRWTNDDKLVTPKGVVMFDDRHRGTLSDQQRGEAYLRDGVRNGGVWVNSPSDNGWILLDARRQPVTKRDGSPVMFTYDQARAAAHTAAQHRAAAAAAAAAPHAADAGAPYVPMTW